MRVASSTYISQAAFCCRSSISHSESMERKPRWTPNLVLDSLAMGIGVILVLEKITTLRHRRKHKEAVGMQGKSA